MTVSDQFSAILATIKGVEGRMDQRFQALEEKVDNAMRLDEEDRKETNRRLTALEFSRAAATGAIGMGLAIWGFATDLFGLLAQQ